MKKMKFPSLVGGLLLLFTASSARAVSINIPGCGDFTIVARDAAQFEQGPTDLAGNVLVTAADGLAKIGAHNEIHGTVIAAKIQVGQGAVIDKCQADDISGPGTCTQVVPGGFAGAPAACKMLPFNPETAPVCVNTGLLVNVPAGQSETLPPGCYGLVRVGAGGTLNLQSGNYFVRQLTLGIGATLQGATPGARSRVLVKNAPAFSPVVRLLDLDIFTAATTGTFELGNSAKYTDVLAVAATAGIHLHGGLTAQDSAFAGVRAIIEPSLFSSPPGSSVCQCAPGFHFANNICDDSPDSSCLASRECVPD